MRHAPRDPRSLRPATHLQACGEATPGWCAQAIDAGLIQAVIFDLDNTLADARQVGAQVFQPAFDAIRAANRGCLSELRLEAALAACWHTAFHTVARTHGFSLAMTRAGAQAFRTLTVPPDAGYVGYPDMPALRRVGAERFLVTSGFRRLQDSKIDTLGIRDLFRRVEIDDPEDHWPDRGPGKLAAFERIRAELDLSPGQVLVVGDNPDAEIAAGNALGMPTVQILRPGVSRSASAALHIHGLTELVAQR